MREDIGKRINCLSTKIKREISNLDSISKLDNVSGANSFIMLYIYKNSDKNIYQKDIENEFGITRSTASNIISLMEKKNFVIRENVDSDLRLKRLVLSSEAIKYCEDFLNDLKSLNLDLCDGISDEELSNFIITLSKIESNLKRRQEK
ncbi:MAG: MarR family transcriptional regulator [Acholeplasmatales bacterium]|nr:MarR family transcriptional regulator [Acholeplasmatales bacterium]